MKAVIVNLECITNMHVGNGDVNYNIIDNEVERDVVTNYPTINSSGVKGALREYFVKKGIPQVNAIFGADNAKADASTPGALKILGADMLALAVRASAGDKPYYLVATDESIKQYKEKVSLFLNQSLESVVPASCAAGKAAEGINLEKAVSLLEKEIFVIPDKEFEHISLPVLARNKLDNGISKNLWYEEIVPYKSLFSFAVLADEQDAELLSIFVNTIKDQIVQFGGNASIGYGLCKVSVMEG